MLSKLAGGSARNFWRAADPVTGDEVNTTDNGVISTQARLDPQGVNVGFEDPFPPPEEGAGACVEYDPNYVPSEPVAANLIPEGESAKCIIDGIEQNCQSVGSESAVQCPDNQCRRFNPNSRNGVGGYEDFHVTNDGRAGYLPIDAIYIGNGTYFSPSTGPRGDSVRSTLTEFNHAHSLPQNPQVIPIRDLKSRVQERLSYGDCADYVKKLIAKVAAQNPSNPAAPTDILGLHDQINSQTNGGFTGTRHLVVVDPATGQRWPVSGSTEGSLARGNAKVQISLVESYGAPNSFNLAHAYITYGIAALHEIIHQSGSQGFYSDYKLAVAAKALNPDVAWSPLTDNSIQSIIKNSGYWDSELKKHCVPASNR